MDTIELTKEEAQIALEALAYGIKVSEVESVKKLLPVYESLEAKLK